MRNREKKRACSVRKNRLHQHCRRVGRFRSVQVAQSLPGWTGVATSEFTTAARLLPNACSGNLGMITQAFRFPAQEDGPAAAGPCGATSDGYLRRRPPVLMLMVKNAPLWRAIANAKSAAVGTSSRFGFTIVTAPDGSCGLTAIAMRSAGAPGFRCGVRCAGSTPPIYLSRWNMCSQACFGLLLPACATTRPPDDPLNVDRGARAHCSPRAIASA
jgi:hypothetical protein